MNPPKKSKPERDLIHDIDDAIRIYGRGITTAEGVYVFRYGSGHADVFIPAELARRLDDAHRLDEFSRLPRLAEAA